MSLQTTLARGEVRHWQAQAREHHAHCGRCARDDQCSSGLAIAGSLAVARGRLRAEQAADRAPIEGQGIFDFETGEDG